MQHNPAYPSPTLQAAIDRRKRPSFDEYFLAIAQTVSIRSDCERSKVGAVLVKDNRILSTGYNGAPAGEPGCIQCPRRLSDCEPGADYDAPDTRCSALHAEMNCLLYARGRDDTIGATLYVTREPCYMCAKVIRAAGIARVLIPAKRCGETGCAVGQCRNQCVTVTEWHG